MLSVPDALVLLTKSQDGQWNLFWLINLFDLGHKLSSVVNRKSRYVSRAPKTINLLFEPTRIVRAVFQAFDFRKLPYQVNPAPVKNQVKPARRNLLQIRHESKKVKQTTDLLWLQTSSRGNWQNICQRKFFFIKHDNLQFVFRTGENIT